MQGNYERLWGALLHKVAQKTDTPAGRLTFFRADVGPERMGAVHVAA